MEDAAALRTRLEELLPLVGEAEKSLEARQREHETVRDAIATTDAARGSLEAALREPVCVAQAAANAALREVAELRREPINEVRALAAPPKPVVRVLGVIHGILFGRDVKAALPPWRELQKMLRKDDFLTRVRGFRVKGSALADEAVVARLKRDIAGKDPGSDGGPLTDAIVRRASQAVAVLFGWAQAQLDLASLSKKVEASDQAPALGAHLDAAETARARLAAAALNDRLREAVERSGLGSRIAIVEAIHSVDTGPQSVEALQAQLAGAEKLLAELQERKAAVSQELDAAKDHLKEAQSEVAGLEVKLEDAQVVRSGPPLCDCGDEMVHREVANLADANWGRKFWKCPRRQGGCGKREWDDSAPVTDILEARIGG